MECVGAGISGGEPPGAHETGGRALQGGLLSRGLVLGPPAVFSVPKILKYSRKNILNLQGIWSTFIFELFFIARINQKTDK